MEKLIESLVIPQSVDEEGIITSVSPQGKFYSAIYQIEGVDLNQDTELDANYNYTGKYELYLSQIVNSLNTYILTLPVNFAIQIRNWEKLRARAKKTDELRYRHCSETIYALEKIQDTKVVQEFFQEVFANSKEELKFADLTEIGRNLIKLKRLKYKDIIQVENKKYHPNLEILQ